MVMLCVDRNSDQRHQTRSVFWWAASDLEWLIMVAELVLSKPKRSFWAEGGKAVSLLESDQGRRRVGRR